VTTIPDFVNTDLEKIGLSLEPVELETLAAYLDLLLDENTRVNLTGIRDRDEAWRRHIIDSLTLFAGLADLPDNATVIDVGSGGGLPGIPLAITNPRLKFTLLEATGKKARFLERCAGELNLTNVTVVNDRAEYAGKGNPYRQDYDAAVCRAVGPLRELLEYTLPFVKVDGILLAMKGPTVEKELRDAGDALAVLGGGEVQVIDAYPEGFNIDTVIVVVDKDRPTPYEYPRLPGTPRREPL